MLKLCIWFHVVAAITSEELYSTKPELGFCAGQLNLNSGSVQVQIQIRDLQWWGSLTVVLVVVKAEHL